MMCAQRAAPRLRVARSRKPIELCEPACGHPWRYLGAKSYAHAKRAGAMCKGDAPRVHHAASAKRTKQGRPGD